MTDPTSPKLELENPLLWAGMATGRSDVTLVLNPGTPTQQRIHLAPLVAIALAQSLHEYAQKQLAAQVAAITRHQQMEDETTERPKLNS